MTTKTFHTDRDITPYQFFMLALCVWTLMVLAAGTFLRLSGPARAILVYADNAICALFFLDFLISFYKAAPRRMNYLLTWGWIDLLSSIPAIDVLRWGRAARVLRILRVLRGVKSARMLTHFAVGRRTESALLTSLLIVILMIVTCSIAVLEFEAPEGGNIASAEDAIWWAVSTVTSAGSGDRFPITSEGRLIAMFLMAAGVGVFTTLAGAAASWFLSPATKEGDVDLEEVKYLLVEVRNRLKDVQVSETHYSPVPSSRGEMRVADRTWT